MLFTEMKAPVSNQQTVTLNGQDTTRPHIRHSGSAAQAPARTTTRFTRNDGPSRALDGVAAPGQDGQGPDDLPAEEAVHVEGDHDVACQCTQCQAAAKRMARIYKEGERLFHERFPEARYYGDRDCDVDHHIWNSLDLQLNHFGCFPEDKQGCLRDVYNRVNYNLADDSPGFWKRQKEFVTYDQTASIVACSTYDNRRNFCRCGFHGYSCGDPLCGRCCFNLRAEPAIAEFGHAFSARNEVYFIVLSLSGEPDERQRIIFKDFTKSERHQIKLQGCFEQGKPVNYGIPFSDPQDLLDVRIFWELFARTIKEFTGRGKPLAGAFGGPELSVRFHPLCGLPHANYVALSDDLTSEDVRAMRRALRERIRGCRRLTRRLYPKIAVYRLPAKIDLLEVIEYIFKPIGIAIPYALSAAKLNHRPEGMTSLNADVNIFFENVVFAFSGLDRMNRYGVCSPSAGKKRYVGVVSEERISKRIVDAKRRKEKRKETEGIQAIFGNAYRPHKRHKSDQDRYDEFLMRAYYRQTVREEDCEGNLPPRLRHLLRFARHQKRSHSDQDAS